MQIKCSRLSLNGECDDNSVCRVCYIFTYNVHFPNEEQMKTDRWVAWHIYLHYVVLLRWDWIRAWKCGREKCTWYAQSHKKSTWNDYFCNSKLKGKIYIYTHNFECHARMASHLKTKCICLANRQLPAKQFPKVVFCVCCCCL